MITGIIAMAEITKASGIRVPFEQEKLRRSLNRVGTDEKLTQQIIDQVMKSLSPGMSTQAIYQIAFKLLRKQSRSTAAKYHLKNAIMHLGVSGYPFEKYFAELLRYQGFQVQNNLFINGYCVSHEVDVVGEKDNKQIFVECKYHHRPGLKCDVTISLYFKARFLDISQGHPDSLNAEGWLVTNTRFSTDAIQYGRCAGLRLIAWDYPDKDSLKDMIENAGLYPITCITNLTKNEQMELIGNNIILCKSLYNDPKILDQLRISPIRKLSIMEQCEKLSTLKK
jgi:hypothetical protein